MRWMYKKKGTVKTVQMRMYQTLMIGGRNYKS